MTMKSQAVPVARLQVLASRVEAGDISEEELLYEIRDIGVLANEYLPREASQHSDVLASSGEWTNLISPEFVEHAIEVSKYLSGALVSSWVARADSRLSQVILRRHATGKRATAAQALRFARYQLNLTWDAGIRASDEASRESIGPDGWSYAWEKGGHRFTVSGDHQLKAVSIEKSDLSSVPE